MHSKSFFRVSLSLAEAAILALTVGIFINSVASILLAVLATLTGRTAQSPRIATIPPPNPATE